MIIYLKLIDMEKNFCSNNIKRKTRSSLIIAITEYHANNIQDTNKKHFNKDSSVKDK